jgi:phage-related holin
MENIDSVGFWLRDIFSNTWAVIVGLMSSLLGYLLPIRDPVNLLLIFFVVDAIVGYLKNRKLHKQPFSKRKIFETTVPRMMAVVMFMILLFALDTEFHQDTVQTYMVVGYFIGGVLLFNVGKNLYEITRWRAFLNIANMVHKNVQDKTGEDIDSPDRQLFNDNKFVQ